MGSVRWPETAPRGDIEHLCGLLHQRQKLIGLVDVQRMRVLRVRSDELVGNVAVRSR